MKDDRHYRDVMCKDYMENVSNAAPLHDIGKIATPDSILQKPGKLTDDEYKIMKEHAAATAEGIRMDWQGNRYHFMQGLWRLRMCLTPFHRKDVIGMQ